MTLTRDESFFFGFQNGHFIITKTHNGGTIKFSDNYTNTTGKINSFVKELDQEEYEFLRNLVPGPAGKDGELKPGERRDVQNPNIIIPADKVTSETTSVPAVENKTE